MSEQKNLFYQFPDKTEITSKIIAARPHFFGTAIAIEENIVRAAGGGEPRDVGKVNGSPIQQVEKQEGKTWIAFDSDPALYKPDTVVEIELDRGHRDQRRRLHTGVHPAIRSAYNHFDDFRVTEAEIAEDASSAIIKGDVSRAIDKGDIAQIDMAMRSTVLKELPVTLNRAKSVDHAEEEHGHLFRVSDRHAFRGKVRLVCIDGFDVNPCSGLHHPDSNIGPYEMRANLSGISSGKFEIKLNLSPCWMYWYGDQTP